MESSNIDESGLAHYASIVSKALSPSTNMHSNATVFTTASNHDPDPCVVGFCRKIMSFRRMLLKRPERIQQVQRIAQYYETLQHPGITNHHEVPLDIIPAPPPGHPQRHQCILGVFMVL